MRLPPPGARLVPVYDPDDGLAGDNSRCAAGRRLFAPIKVQNGQWIPSCREHTADTGAGGFRLRCYLTRYPIRVTLARQGFNNRDSEVFSWDNWKARKRSGVGEGSIRVAALEHGPVTKNLAGDFLVAYDARRLRRRQTHSLPGQGPARTNDELGIFLNFAKKAGISNSRPFWG